MPSEQQEAATNAEDLGRLLSRAADLAEITGELAPTLRRAADAARIQASTAARLAAPSTPVDRDGLIEIVATNQLRRYDEEFDASHLSWRDFESSAAEDVDALISAGVVAQPPAEDGVALIAAERRRAIASGWTAEHDDLKTSGSLAEAGICYAANPNHLGIVDDLWPWDIQYWNPTPDDRIQELAKAGQFIAAEIDRLLRARDSNREAGQP